MNQGAGSEFMIYDFDVSQTPFFVEEEGNLKQVIDVRFRGSADSSNVHIGVTMPGGSFTVPVDDTGTRRGEIEVKVPAVQEPTPLGLTVVRHGVEVERYAHLGI